MKKYYSLREISAELDIPKSTIVKYKDYFGDFLPMAGEGKRKKFEESALEVLKDIRRFREDENLDWLEIKDKLQQKYGEEESPAQIGGIVRVEPAAAMHMEHLKHMVNAVAGELVSVSENVKRLDERTLRHTEALKVIAKYAEYSKRNIELVIADLMARENDGRKHMQKIADKVESEFALFRENLDRISEEVSAGPGEVTGNGADGLKEVNEKLEKIIGAKTADANRYQVLQKENEALRRKLIEATRKPPAQMPAPLPQPVTSGEPQAMGNIEGGHERRRRERPSDNKKPKSWMDKLLGR